MSSRSTTPPADAGVDVAALLGRCAFPMPGTAVTCAVSGGADSTALLVLAVAAGCVVTAVHVDHGLRPTSAADAAVAARAAAHVGTAFRSVHAPVPTGPNLEARARAARYAALPCGALTGHTADDQAETVVLNLLRGAGLDGLRGMRRDGRRPIIDLRRAETRALCAALGIETVDDPTNGDPAHVRNRVRHEVLPLLDLVARRDVAALLARQSELLGDDAQLLDGLADAIDPTDARAVAAAPRPLAARALRRWLRAACGGEEHHPPSAAALDRVLAVARGDARAAQLPGGHRVERHGGALRVVADRRA